MRWPSFLQRQAAAPAAAGDDAVQAARLRARRRLIGAVVLLALGLVAFPLLFETQPRPVAPDIPYETSRRPSAATAPVVRPIEPAAEPRPAPPPAAEPAPAPQPVAESPPAIAPAAPAPPAPSKPAPATTAATTTSRTATTAATTTAATTTSATTAAPPAPAPASEAASAPADLPRFVLQVGAYAEAATVRDVRARVEKLGLKTYTQVVETPSGARTRVRIGPFESRDAAAAAGERLKAAGLPFNLLAL